MQGVLSPQQTDQFIHEGFVRLDGAFSARLAGEARRILWADTGCNPEDPATWTKPVIRLGMYAQPPFVAAANTPGLHRAFDQLVGPGRWLPCRSMGTFPVRFPSAGDPGDTGWHVDASFPGADPDNYFEWRINVWSEGRALLMLFLFSDVSERDAPTRIRAGSHLDVARVLARAGAPGLSFTELAAALAGLPERKEVSATGPAGTVYLCHPFVAHAAQPHRGSQPRFLAQPPLLPKGALIPEGPLSRDTPVAAAIREALSTL